ncbi:MAG: phage late control D family protein [Polyangiaceae bacterium]
MINERLEVTVSSGDTLDVRHFNISERVSSLFEISLVCTSENPDIDFEAVAGQPMSLRVKLGTGAHQERLWTGICNQLQQVAVEDQGLSTYQLTLVPTLWLLTQRRNHRMFQLKSELDIALLLLGEWGIEPVQRISGTYKKRKYRVQYGETDFAFLSRMLEDAGISFFFETEGAETQMILHDAPQSASVRDPAIAFRDNPSDADMEHVTEVRVGRRVRPGTYTLRDATTAGRRATSCSRQRRARQAWRESSSATAYAGRLPLRERQGRRHAERRRQGNAAPTRARPPRSRRSGSKRSGPSRAPSPSTRARSICRPASWRLPRSLRAGSAPATLILSRSRGAARRHVGRHCEAVSADAYRPPMDTPKPKVVGVEERDRRRPRGRGITPTSSAACAATSTGIARAGWTRAPRAGST